MELGFLLTAGAIGPLLLFPMFLGWRLMGREENFYTSDIFNKIKYILREKNLEEQKNVSRISWELSHYIIQPGLPNLSLLSYLTFA